MIGLRSRLAVALLVFGLCLVYALPSVPYIGTALENVLPSKKINLGLDLKGGIHLTLGVDVAKAVSNSLALAGQDIRRLAKDEKIVVLHPRVVGNDKLEFALPRVDDEAKLQEILQKNFPQLNVGEPRRTEAGLRYVAEFRPEEISRIEDMALDQALRTIRNRIDQFGVAEPDIRKQEGNRIQVQLPGLSDPRRAVQILGQTAHLEFHLVRDDVDPNKAVLPSGVMALPLLEKGHDGSETATRLIAVEKDAILIELTGDDLTESVQSASETLRSAEISMQNMQDTMANYTITAPISGTVIEKDVKQGDALTSGTSLCVLYDLSYLEMSINVDELEIGSLSVGQKVQITADAVADKTYVGTVTRVSMKGNSSGGTTTYPVTIRIDSIDGLRPGMNANAEIVVAESTSALCVPNAAIVRGGYVLVTKDSPSAANADPEMEAPDGYVYVDVKTGVSDDDYTEILDGITAEDTIAYDPNSVSDSYYDDGSGFYDDGSSSF